MAGDGEAEQLIHVTEDFGDRYVEIRAFRVPDSDRYPEGQVLDAVRQRSR